MKKIILLGVLSIFILNAKGIDKCIGCHGKNFEISALGKSGIVKNMTKDTIITSLKAYKKGTLNRYGMGALMKEQIASFTDNEIENIVFEITKTEDAEEDIKFVKANQLLGTTFYTYSLNAKNEKCELMYKNNEKLSDETCISLTNSKGVKIHCTKTKKMCKTEEELNVFVSHANIDPEEGLESEGYRDEATIKKPIAEYENKLEDFGVLIDSCEDLDTTYEKKQCRKNIGLSKYKFTGKITNVLSKSEFTIKVASEHYVDVKGDFNIDAVLKVQKSGETITIIGILTNLGTGMVFHHKANFIKE